MDNSAIMIWGLLFSSAGLGYFIYGRRQHHKLVFYAGIGLMIYPYFVGSVSQMLVLGAGIMIAPWVIKL